MPDIHAAQTTKIEKAAAEPKGGDSLKTQKKGRRGGRTLVGILTLLLILFGIYVVFVERQLLTVKKDSLELGENPTQSVKIVQFTDTHLGAFYSLEQLERAVEQINAQNPDLVVFTGDLFDVASRFEEFEGAASLLGKIEASLGKYAIWGNRDYGGGASRVYPDLMEAAGFTLLTGERETLSWGDKEIVLYGADDAIFGYPDNQSLMEGIQEAQLNLLLVHEPDVVNQFANYPIDMAFSGHSHGGQINLPFYGPLVKTNYCESYFKGLYCLDNQSRTYHFVSSGLGNTKLPLRLGNLPEIVVFELYF